jgi:hypothetical protein
LIQTRGPEPATPVTEVKLAVGTIGSTHGVQGELKMHLLTDQPEHLKTIRHVYLGTSDEPTQLEGLRFHGDGVLIKLAGVENPEDGKKLGGLAVRIDGRDANSSSSSSSAYAPKLKTAPKSAKSSTSWKPAPTMSSSSSPPEAAMTS